MTQASISKYDSTIFACMSFQPSWTTQFKPTSWQTPETQYTKHGFFVWVAKAPVTGWGQPPAMLLDSTSQPRSSSLLPGGGLGSRSTVGRGYAQQSGATTGLMHMGSTASIVPWARIESQGIITCEIRSSMRHKWLH